jgi:hypothetical protein
MVCKFIRLMALLAIAFSLASLSRAQTSSSGSTQQPSQPVSPLGPEKTVDSSVQGNANSSGDNTQLTVPDTRPLAGAQDLTLGSVEDARSFLLPSFSVITLAGNDTYGTGVAGTPDILSTTFVAGRLGLNKISTSSQFLLDYVAGGSFSNDPTVGDSIAQGLNISETVTMKRWTLLLADRFYYVSDSLFGYGGLGGIDKLGVGLGSGAGTSTGLSPTLSPTGSIYLTGLPRVDNGGVGQLSYDISRRAKLTILGADQLEDFKHSELQNSNEISVQAGYDYMLSRLNSIGFMYRFDDFNFAVIPQAIHDHTAEILFARRVTGRLTWQVGAGPSVQEYVNPVSGAGTVVAPTVFTGVLYRLRNTSFGASYMHGLSSGSGLFPGAEADVFAGQARHAFGKSWSLSVNGGYARNAALRETSTTASGLALNTWFVNTTLSRIFVAYGSLFISYNASGQSSLSTVCTLPGCKLGATVNTGSIGYTWGLRPIFLE